MRGWWPFPSQMRLPILSAFWIALITLSSCLGTNAQAGDRIWSAVVLATRENPAKPPPARLADFAGPLQRIFGYNTFYLLGEKTKDIRAGTEDWLVPSKRIFMKVSVLGTSRVSYHTRVDLYDGKELLVTAEARLARDAPLYIRGPAWGKGQLIAILEVR